MTSIGRLFKKEWNVKLALLVCSFLIYFGLLPHQFLHLNTLLSSITLDSIKNYYTFVYHIKNDADALNFAGMNYPLGEHVIYTDCQPMITFLLRLMPFAHDYLIGIMHALLYGSFIVTPLVLFSIFRRLSVDILPSFFFSLAIGLLSPQFLKINAGHHALAYGCIFPLSILFLLDLIEKKTIRYLITVLIFNSALFFLHPYLGFSLSVLSLLTLAFYAVLDKEKIYRKTLSIYAFLSGIIPILFFRAFMTLTDHHKDRTNEPYGTDVMVENLDSLIAPVFGPFRSLLETILNDRPQHFEGHTYLGFFTIILCLATIVSLPWIFKQRISNKPMTAIFLASLVILLISFGYHTKILKILNVKIAAVSQFRAVCRFAWVFYFTLPLFVIAFLFGNLQNKLKQGTFQKLVLATSVLFLILNFIEARAMFSLDEKAYWHFRNFFSEKQLNTEEKRMLESIKTHAPQAILPLPVFHGGSEMYDRNGSSNSMVPSMIYSYHSSIPILSVMMSRTSMSETEHMIETLNSYKRNRTLPKLFNGRDLLVIKTNDELLPDEERIVRELSYIEKNDTLAFAYISQKDLLRKKVSNSPLNISQPDDHVYKDNVIFIQHEDRPPFTRAHMDNYEKVCELDSNRLETGQYIVSLHYHYKEKVFQSLSVGLIITETTDKKHEWIHNISLRKLSGFYPGYGVFEYNLELRKNSKYEFLLKGLDGREYHISHFLLRPRNRDVYFIASQRDTVYNNFYP